MIFPLKMHAQADAYRRPVGRTKLRYEARAIVQLDEDYSVRDGERRMSLVMHYRVAVNRP